MYVAGAGIATLPNEASARLPGSARIIANATNHRAKQTHIPSRPAVLLIGALVSDVRFCAHLGKPSPLARCQQCPQSDCGSAGHPRRCGECPVRRPAAAMTAACAKVAVATAVVANLQRRAVSGSLRHGRSVRVLPHQAPAALGVQNEAHEVGSPLCLRKRIEQTRQSCMPSQRVAWTQPYRRVEH